MHVLAFLWRRSPVGRRPHQRVPEPHPGADLQQTGLGRRGRGLGADAEPLGRPPHQHRIPDRVGDQAAGHEPRDLRRGLVQPLGVVDHTDQRVLRGGVRKQAERGQPTRKRSGSISDSTPAACATRQPDACSTR